MSLNKGQDPVAKKVARMLLEAGAVKFNPENPFKWSSGWFSPIYCDNRLTLSFPEIRTFIKEQLAGLIKQKYGHTEAIAGVATAGLPQGALVADFLELPYLYVRSKPKGHGMENLVEGRVIPGQKVVLVEDLISTGGSSLGAAEGLKSVGLEVLGMVAIFTYGFEVADKNFRKSNISHSCLCNYQVLIEEAIAQQYVSPDKLASLESWRTAPDQWTPES